MHSDDTSTKPGLGKTVAGGTLLAIAVCAGAINLVINISSGLEASHFTAVVYGLADAAKIALPIVCVAIGWNWLTRAAMAICVTMSLFCVSTYYLSSYGEILLKKQGMVEEYRHAKDEVKRITGDVEQLTRNIQGLGVTGDSETLLEAARISKEQANTEEKKGGRGAKWNAANSETGRLTEEAGRAKRKAELETQLASAKMELKNATETLKRSGGPKDVGGDAATLAGLINENPETVARWLATVKSLGSLILLEILTYLSIPAMLILRHLKKKETACSATLDEVKQPETVSVPPVPQIPMARETKAKRKRKDRDEAETPSNVVSIAPSFLYMNEVEGKTQREISIATGLSLATVNRRIAKERSEAKAQRCGETAKKQVAAQ